MSMLPFGTYPNEDGQGEHLGFAMPGMIQEPINALSRLFGTPSNPGTFGQGPDAPGNKEDMTTLLMSMYGGNAMNPAAAIPKGALASGALREAPQRMYHGTAAAEDFSHFRPSSEGSFGPGVYLSENPAIASQRALLDDGSRVFPVDAQGPFASMDDYLTALHANGRDPAAAQQSLGQQGYTGVSGDLGSYGSPKPVTNVFAPGSIRSATTGETLFSDTGRPSLFGSAIAGAEHPIGHMPSDLIEQAGAAGTIPYAGVGQLSSTDTLVHQLMANRPTVSVKTGERIAGTNDRQGPPLTTYDTIALDQAWRDKIRRTGELYSDGLPSIWGNALMDYAQNDQGPGNYLKDRMNQPYQPAPGEDFQYQQDPADVQRLQDWIGRHQRHDLPPKQAEELMKRDPEYQNLYRKLWTPRPYNPEPPLR
jgi:hypothetical protein